MLFGCSLFDGRLLERELERKTSFKAQIRMISGEPYEGFLKWMVYKRNPIKMDDLGGTTIFGNIHI